MKGSTAFVVAGLAGVCVLALATGAGARSTGSSLTCSSGTIPAGSYDTLTISGGVCSLPDSGSVVVQNGVTIAASSGLNGVTAGTLTVNSGGITVARNGILALGCSPAAGCDVTTDDSVAGGIVARNALAVILHSNTVSGGISVMGGGGGVNCRNRPALGGPAFSTFEDNQITGDLNVGGMNSCWLGVFRNTVQGTIAVFNNKMADPDANEITDNQVHGNLTCFGNSPVAQPGDSGGGPNNVTGTKAFECASL